MPKKNLDIETRIIKKRFMTKDKPLSAKERELIHLDDTKKMYESHIAKRKADGLDFSYEENALVAVNAHIAELKPTK